MHAEVSVPGPQRSQEERVCLSSLPLVETAISRVFLGTRSVWKLKKALAVRGLDWREPRERRRACEREFALGRRVAERVYRAVVPVGRDAGGRLEIGTEGPTVDWAVEMARLPRAQRLDVRLAGGRLDPSWMRAIAEHLARFHDAAPAGSDVERFATPAALRERIDAALDRVLGSGPDAEALMQVAERQRAGLALLGDAMRERTRSGRIREGHGDLRCEHVYVDATGGVAVLDPLEGERGLRCADVCADLALLSVDLRGRGRADLAERLLAAYADAALDCDLYALVDFYEHQRAFERACGALLLATDPALPEALSERAERDGRRYTRLARADDRPAPLPRSVVATTGLVASGKSTVAAALAERMGVPRIEADKLRHALAVRDPAAGDELSARLRSLDREFEGLVYAEALRCADAVLASGRGVVLDACFPTAAARAQVAELAARHQVPVVFAECRAPFETIRARLAQRAAAEGAGADGWMAIYDGLAARYEPPREAEDGTHLPLDTALPLDHNLARLQQHIPTWPPEVFA